MAINCIKIETKSANAEPLTKRILQNLENMLIFKW